MKTVLLSVILALAVFAAGCGKSDPAGPSTPTNHFPIKVGDYWDYSITGEGNISGTSFTLVGIARMEVTGTSWHVEGFDLFKVRFNESVILISGGAPQDTLNSQWEEFYRVQETQVIAYDSNADTTPFKFLELPLTAGNTWNPGFDDPAGKFEVISVSAEITIPMGTYTNCGRVHYTNSTDPNYYQHFYFIPGKGLGRRYIYNQQGSNTLDYNWNLSSSSY